MELHLLTVSPVLVAEVPTRWLIPLIEAAGPYTAFKKAGFEVSFATENGKPPLSDKLLLEGLTQKLLVRP